MKLKFLYNLPAAVFGKWIIISDIHIDDIKGHWKVAACEVEEILESTGKSKLLILGDVKKSITKGEYGAAQFIKEIGSRYELHITKGNHDGNIEKYSDYCKVHGPGGVRIGNVGFLHGHAWPDEELLACGTLAIGHVHPSKVFGEGWMLKVPVWIMGSIHNLKKYYRKNTANKNMKLVCFPSFASYISGAGSTFGSSERPISPLLREDIFIKKSAKIFLLNGIRIE
ncbi:MAG: metallophosphoesterase [Candidatus Micrarchaeia archaeon]